MALSPPSALLPSCGNCLPATKTEATFNTFGASRALRRALRRAPRRPRVRLGPGAWWVSRAVPPRSFRPRSPRPSTLQSPACLETLASQLRTAEPQSCSRGRPRPAGNMGTFLLWKTIMRVIESARFWAGGGGPEFNTQCREKEKRRGKEERHGRDSTVRSGFRAPGPRRFAPNPERTVAPSGTWQSPQHTQRCLWPRRRCVGRIWGEREGRWHLGKLASTLRSAHRASWPVAACTQLH